MKTIEYGTQNKDIILLLHGGGLSWWNYRETAELLQYKYHVILPILDGHSESDKDFTSIQDNALEIIKYIDTNYNGSVLLIGGLSLGAQILLEILAIRSDICQIAIIESALILPMKLTHFLLKPMLEVSYGLIKQNWFSRLQFHSLKIKKELFDEYYQDTCNITKENMIAFLQANSCYNAKETIKDTQAEIFIFVGEKESRKMILSAQKLHKILPNSSLEIKYKMYHGEYSINHSRDYTNQLLNILDMHHT